MKKLIGSICIIGSFVLVGLGQAQDIPASNPKLGLEGNTVTMQVDIAGATTNKQVKILFKGKAEGFGEGYEIQPYSYWYMNVDREKTTPEKCIRTVGNLPR